MALASASWQPPSGTGRGKPPQYWCVYPHAFSDDECERLVALFADLDQSDGGLVVDRFDHNVRKSTLVWIPDRDDLDWVHARMTRLAADANRDLFRYALDGFEEQLQLAAYGPGHHYDWHIDRGRGPVAGRRKLTLSVQLSAPEAYVGGELELNADGRPFQAPKERGTAVAFAATTLHRVAPVVGGLRQSLVAWIHGPDFV
ncbi:MAG: 2OG-Fe(II) oxygenase [Alphaproteobacteria bacterium]|nr:2OG-Fe(II) oxygenase [Alphaproteobacteria bacterium]MBF0249634.1 2OG-Fe(II) oxygenase [Alphaproteobacteria bacterium]